MLRIDEMPEFRKLNSKKFIQVKPIDTISSVLKKMAAADVHGVTIVKDKKPIGIFTENDALKKILLGKVKLTDNIETVMTKNPKTLKTSHRTGDAIEVMKKGNIRYLPIIDDHGNLAGMISLRDLVSLDWEDLWIKLKRRGLVEFFQSSQAFVLLSAALIYIAVVVTILL